MNDDSKNYTCSFKHLAVYILEESCAGCNDLMRDVTLPSARAGWDPQNLLLSHKLSSNIYNENLLLFIMRDATGVVYLDIIFSLGVFINKCLQVL